MVHCKYIGQLSMVNGKFIFLLPRRINIGMGKAVMVSLCYFVTFVHTKEVKKFITFADYKFQNGKVYCR